MSKNMNCRVCLKAWNGFDEMSSIDQSSGRNLPIGQAIWGVIENITK
ncbi:hypothetical protein SAMN05192574_101822 [Mucilaginibacter gossypiicola]|uniref:Uncharacterized protein n=1 Tax=Mucilaginibacter gossypiicola TaxID=551995 RepID=A0A1H8BAJ0_9SPHI|nr:hypothetical protein [Mucilaginibacter gossypiicola]SEM79028.1 hypothetical protein SAMN05192574_101822 [Mucilaginibacter gossypiicola]